MASSGALADFSKRPPAFKAGVFLAIAVVLGALYYQFVFAKMRRELKAAEDDKAGLLSKQDKIKKEVVEYGQLKEQQTKLEAIIKENSSALPTAAQLPGFFDLLNQQVKEAQVEVRRWDYLKELPVEDMYKVPVEISIAGTYFELEHFFYLLYKVSQKEDPDAPAVPPVAPGPDAPADPTASSAEAASKLKLEERGRILTIENLVIDQPEIKNNELIMVATFRASTFRKEPVVVEEEDPKAKAKKEKADKKAAKKSTTQKVKDKAEDAADKSDARAREAGGTDSAVPTTRDDKGVDAVKKGM